MKRKMDTIATLVKTKLTDNVKISILLFIVIFSVLSLIYITCFNTDSSEEINQCLKSNDLEYCIK